MSSTTPVSELIFSNFPHLRQVEGLADFINSQDHIKFEKADLRNDKDVFKQMIMDNKLNCMMIHMKNTIFKWKNWKKFIIETGLYNMIINKGKENFFDEEEEGGDMRTKFNMKKDKIDAWYMVNFNKIPSSYMS